MMSHLYLTAVCVAFLYTLVQHHPHGLQIGDQDLFAFPADEEEISAYLTNAQNRTPVYIPGKCSQGEILYPGDHATDWVCDCRPGYVYYPKNDACYALFTKGFCEEQHYVDLERPSMIVTCTNNTCTVPNTVPFRGQCVELNTYDRRCSTGKSKRYVVAVNTTTLELDCILGGKSSIGQRVDAMEDDDVQLMASKLVLFVGANRCSNGTKATHDKLCV